MQPNKKNEELGEGGVGNSISMSQKFFYNGPAKIALGSNDEKNNENGHHSKRTADITIDESLDFGSMLLSEPILKGLSDSGFKRPTPVQLKTIPSARCGVDLIVQAKAGTGKTCVFVVTALETLVLSSSAPQVIILAPTREIACQIYEAAKSIGRHMIGLKCGCFIGGSHVSNDKVNAKDAQIIIGSPGRISQLIQEGDISADGIRLLVLDEADKLMDDSYQENINWIFSKLPVNKQVLVLSATYPRELDDFLAKYMRNPQKIKIDSTDVQLIGVKQYLSIIKPAPGGDWFEKRIEHLHMLLSKISFSQCLIFVNFQDKVELLCSKLKERNWAVDFIGAHISQSQRLNVIKRLKSFRCRILISTDLTARGIDAEKVNLVINFDIPYCSETYLHRIGRAGRYGGYGAGITLLCGWQAELNFYQMIAEHKLHIKLLPDQFPNDLASDEEFYVSLPEFVLPDLSLYERKSVIKAAKTSARAITGSQNYKNIIRKSTLPLAERLEPTKYVQKPKFTPMQLSEQFDRSTLKYERDSMLKVLKCLLNVKEDEKPDQDKMSSSSSSLTRDNNNRQNVSRSISRDRGAKTKTSKKKPANHETVVCNGHETKCLSNGQIEQHVVASASAVNGTGDEEAKRCDNSSANVGDSVGVATTATTDALCDSNSDPVVVVTSVFDSRGVVEADVASSGAAAVVISTTTDDVELATSSATCDVGSTTTTTATANNTTTEPRTPTATNISSSSMESSSSPKSVAENASHHIVARTGLEFIETVVKLANGNKDVGLKPASASLDENGQHLQSLLQKLSKPLAIPADEVVHDKSLKVEEIEEVAVNKTVKNNTVTASTEHGDNVGLPGQQTEITSKPVISSESTTTKDSSEIVDPNQAKNNDVLPALTSKTLEARYFEAFTQTYDEQLNQIYGGFAWRMEVAEAKSVPLERVSQQNSSDAGGLSPTALQPHDDNQSKKTDLQVPSKLIDQRFGPAPNAIKYNYEQMQNLYTLASSMTWPHNDTQKRWQKIAKKLKIFKDHVTEKFREYKAFESAPNGLDYNETQPAEQNAELGSHMKTAALNKSCEYEYEEGEIHDDADNEFENYDEEYEEACEEEYYTVKDEASDENEKEEKTGTCWLEYVKLLQKYESACSKALKCKTSQSSRDLFASYADQLKKYKRMIKHH